MCGSGSSPRGESCPLHFERVHAGREESVQMDIDVRKSTSRLALPPNSPWPGSGTALALVATAATHVGD